MVKCLIALAMLPRLAYPTQPDMENYINNYINNTCQYLRYVYDQTQQTYILQDKLTSYNEQTSNATFNFTVYLDYTITERITHYWNIGDAFSVYLAYGNDPTQEPNIKGTCEKILTLDSEQKKYKVYDLTISDWQTIEPLVLNDIPSQKVADEIFVYNESYALNSAVYKAGSDAGYAIGYKTGYGEGKVATTPLNNTFDLFKTISTSLASFWNIPILPGINLGLLISIPITTGIVIWVIKALKE